MKYLKMSFLTVHRNILNQNNTHAGNKKNHIWKTGVGFYSKMALVQTTWLVKLIPELENTINHSSSMHTEVLHLHQTGITTEVKCYPI